MNRLANRNDIWNQIVGMHLQCATPTAIARELAISRPMVYFWIKWYAEEGRVEARKFPGAAKKTTAEEDKKIVAVFTEDPFLKSTKIRSRLQLSIPPRTVRRLHKAGLHNHVATRKEILTDNHKQWRMEFARQYIDKGLDFWSRVMFSDEKKKKIN